MLNQETNIYYDNPRWPLHILIPAPPSPELTFMAGAIFTSHCTTPYVQPKTFDPSAFRVATENGRLVCQRCAAWVEENHPPVNSNR